LSLHATGLGRLSVERASGAATIAAVRHHPVTTPSPRVDTYLLRE